MNSFFNKNFRPAFYSLTINLALFLSVNELVKWETYRNSYVFLGAAIILFVIEIILMSLENHHDLLFFRELDNKKTRLLYFLDIVFLPLTATFLVHIFGLINYSYEFLIVLITNFLLLFIIFKHLSKVFSNRIITVFNPHFSSDLYKLYIVFLVAGIFKYYINKDTGNLSFMLLVVFTTVFSLSVLNFAKLEFVNFKYRMASLIIGSIMSLIFLASKFIGGLEVSIMFYSTYFMLFFYILLAAFQQFLDKSLTTGTVIRYAYVIILFTLIVVLL